MYFIHEMNAISLTQSSSPTVTLQQKLTDHREDVPDLSGLLSGSQIVLANRVG